MQRTHAELVEYYAGEIIKKPNPPDSMDYIALMASGLAYAVESMIAKDEKSEREMRGKELVETR